MKIKARKIHLCIICSGNIQKGERYEFFKFRVPRYDDEDKQIGVSFHQGREHSRDCFPRLLHYSARKEILKNCNFGIHNPTFDRDPDSCDDSIYCSWCGRELISFENPTAK